MSPDDPYLADILEQPQALARTGEMLEAQLTEQRILDAMRTGPTILTGMGSSHWALLPLYQRMRAAGLPVWSVETSDLLDTDRGHTRSGAVIVAASQSGASAETVQLLKERHPSSTVVAITNTPESDLHQGSDAAILLGAGPEATVATKSYVTTLLAAAHLADQVLAVAPLPPTSAAEAVSGYLDKHAEHLEELADMLSGAGVFFLTGRNSSVAAAMTGALIIKESIQVPAEGMTAPAFRHGPLEMADRTDLRILVFSGHADNREPTHRLIKDIHAIGGWARAVGLDGEGCLRLPATDQRICPILEILPVQLATIAYAASRGRSAGQFRHLSKVTRVL